MSFVQLVGHVSEVARPGDYLCIPMMRDDSMGGLGRYFDIGEIAVANVDGELFAFDNRCPHRGARIFEGMAGHRPPRCAYHGRTIGPNYCNRRFSLIEYEGWLLVSDEAEVPMPMWTAFLPRAEDVRLHAWRTFRYSCGWQVAVENTLDYEHVEHVHADTFKPLGMKPLTPDLFGDGSSHQQFIFEDRERLDRVAALFERSSPGVDYFHLHMFPFTCMSSTRGLTFSLQHYVPAEYGQGTRLIHRLYHVPPKSGLARTFISLAEQFNERVFEEDAEICARVPDIHEVAMLGPADVRIEHFRKALAPRSF